MTYNQILKTSVEDLLGGREAEHNRVRGPGRIQSQGRSALTPLPQASFQVKSWSGKLWFFNNMRRLLSFPLPLFSLINIRWIMHTKWINREKILKGLPHN